MSFDWGDYLKFAKALEAKPDTPGPREASLRSAFNNQLQFTALRIYAHWNDHPGDDFSV